MCHCNMYSYGYNEFCFMRVKCIVSYDGTRFHGFQVQNNERTIQGEIQKAIKKINEEETFTGYRPERLENLVLEWQR